MNFLVKNTPYMWNITAIQFKGRLRPITEVLKALIKIDVPETKNAFFKEVREGVNYKTVVNNERPN